MKKQVIALLAFLSVFQLTYAQDFEVTFSGIDVEFTEASNDYNVYYQSNFYNQIIGENYLIVDALYTQQYGLSSFLWATDFSSNNPVNLWFNPFFSGYDNIKASCVGANNHLYEVIRYSSTTSLYGIDYVASGNYGSVIVELDENGAYIAGKNIDIEEQISAITVDALGTIYFTYKSEVQIIATIDMNVASSINNIGVIPMSIQPENLKLKGDNLYIKGRHNTTQGDLLYGNTTVPVVDLAYTFNGIIAVYDLVNNMEVNAIYLTDPLYSTSFDDFEVSDNGDLYVTVSSNMSLNINNTLIPIEGNTSQAIIKVLADGTVAWSKTIENRGNNKTKLALTGESLYAIGDYNNYSGEVFFIANIDGTPLTYTELDQNGIYMVQMDLNSGYIINQDAFYGSAGGNGFTALNFEYNQATDNLVLVFSTNGSGSVVNSLSGQEYLDYANSDLIRVLVKNKTPEFKIKDFYDGYNKAYIGCRGANMETYIDFRDNVYHPTENLDNITYTVDAPLGTNYDLLGSQFNLLSYTKVNNGYDSIKVTATDLAMNTAVGYIYLYQLDPATAVWNDDLARRCFGQMPGTEPDFVSVEIQLPEELNKTLTNEFLFFAEPHTLYDGLEYHNWESDTSHAGVYDFTYKYGYDFSLIDQSQFTCYDSVSYSNYRINGVPSANFILPDTICSSIWLEDYVDYKGGTFYIEPLMLQQIPQANGMSLYEGSWKYGGTNSYYDYMNGVDSATFYYEYFDPISGCQINEQVENISIKQASILELENNTFIEYCTAEGMDSINLISNITDSITWYNDGYRADSIYAGIKFKPSFIEPDVHEVYVSAVNNGCPTIPVLFEFYVNQSPTANVIGDTLMCVDDITSKVTLEDELASMQESLYITWTNIDNPAIPLEISSGQLRSINLEAGSYFVQVETEVCSAIDTFNVSVVNVNPPVVTDVNIAYGKPAPALVATGDSITWYTTNETLLFKGNALETGLRPIGTYEFLATETIEDCESEYSTGTITISLCPATQPVFIDDTISICENLNDYVLFADNPDVQWFNDRTKISLYQPSDSLVFSDLTPGYYTYYAAEYNAGLNCYSDASAMTLEVLAKPQVYANYPSFSTETDSIDLMSYTLPQSGLFEGDWVVNDSIFLGTEAGEGEFNIKYTYTNEFGCFDSIVRTVTVYPGSLLVTDINAADDTVYVMLNESKALTATLVPNNATYKTVTWTSNNSQIAEITTGGIVTANTIDTTYAVVEWINDNTISDTVVIIVTEPINAEFSDLGFTCINNAPFALTGGTPIGGSYFGEGVNQNYFYPSLVTSGLHSLGYAFTDQFGNKDTAYANIDVIEVVEPIVKDTIVEVDKTIPVLEAAGNSIVWYKNLTLQDTLAEGQILDHGKTEIGEYTFYATNTDDVTLCVSNTVSATLSIIANDTIAANSLVAVNDTVYLNVNEQVQLLASLFPANTTVKEFTWLIGNSQTATITDGGLVTGITADTTLAIVEWNFDNSIADTVVVIVNKPLEVTLLPFYDVCVNSGQRVLSGGQPAGGKYFGTGVIGSYFVPSDAGAGEHIISYSYEDSYGNKDTAYSTITVLETEAPIVEDITVEITETIPNFVTEGEDIVWYKNITLVDTLTVGNTFEHGKTEVGYYTFYVTNKENNCISNITSAHLTILPSDTTSASKIVASLDTVYALVNENKQLLASLVPSNATVQDYTWTVINSNVATITENGLLTIVSADTTLAIVQWDFDNSIADTVVVIGMAPTNVTLDVVEKICYDAEPIELTGGLPLGGKYFGAGVSQSIFNPEGLSAGENTIGYAFVDSYGNKDTAYASVNVIIPEAPIVSDVSAVEYGVIPNLIAEGDSINWYANVYLEDTLATGNSFNHEQTTQGVYSYYAVNVEQECLSIPKKVNLRIEACVLQQPQVVAKALVQCENDQVKSFEAAAINNIQWFNNNDELVFEGNVFTPTVTEYGNTFFYAKQYDGECFSSPVSLQYTYAQNPVVTISAPDTIVTDRNFSVTASIENTDKYINTWILEDTSYAYLNLDFIFNNPQDLFLVNRVVDTRTACVTSQEITVVVEEKYVAVESLDIAEDSITLYESFSQPLDVILAPYYATDLTTKWTVNNLAVAKVLENEVYALTEGETWAYVIANDNGIVDSVHITVEKYFPVSEITLPQTINVTEGDVIEVKASIIPVFATVQNVKYVAKEDSIISFTANGTLTAKKAGMSTITAFSHDGSKYASAVVFVAEEIIAPTALSLAPYIHTIKNSEAVVSLSLQPEFASTDNIIWYTEDETIATVSNSGVISSSQTGITTLYVKDTVEDITASAQLRVTNSLAPQLYPLPNLQMKQIQDSIVFDVSYFVKDDSTALADLIWSVTSSANTEVSLVGSILTVKPASGDYIGNDTLVFTVADSEGSTATETMIVTLIEKPNEAPIVADKPFLIPFVQAFNDFDLSAWVKDDYSSASEITWEFEENEKFEFVKTGKYVIITSVDRTWYGVDSISVSVTDRHGLTVNTKLAVQVIDKPNEAPEVKQIPVQYNNDTTFFSYIELNNFVTDDYTSASDIKWSVSGSEVMFVKFVENIALLKITNPFWSGAEKLTFTAMDQHGAKTSVDVLFVQEQSRGDNWVGDPLVDFVASREYGVPNDAITLYGSLSGAISWKWSVEGVALEDSSKVIQDVVFEQPGKYNVSLWAQNSDGIETLVKEEFITIYGIVNRNPEICKGDRITLTVNDEDLDGYLWSTGASSSSLMVKPDKTTVYSVAISDGLFSFVDKVTVRVSVPVNLGQDSSICAGTIYELDAGNYVDFQWNTQETSRTIKVSQPGTYSVTTVDDIGCTSTDAFVVPSILPLPTLDLGNDTTLCDGEILILNAGLGYSYEWSNGTNGQQLFVDTTTTVGVTITDQKFCQATDSISVTYRYPYTEQLGVVTASQTTDNLVIAWRKTLDQNTMKYELYRETNVSGTWSLVQEVNFDEKAIVVDSLTNYVTKAYRYALVTIDSCGNRSGHSISHRSMNLQTGWSTDINKKMQLRWTPYEPASAVETYIIYRGDSDATLEPVDSLAASELYLQWNDPISNPNSKYRVMFRTKDTIDESKYYKLKEESGPFSLVMSNIAEAEVANNFNDVSIEADIAVYPLPFNNKINVIIAGYDEADYTIELMNIQGQVLSSKTEFAVSKTIVEFPTENLPNGVYTIKVSKGNAFTSIKIVK